MMSFETIHACPRVFQQLTGFTGAAFAVLLVAFERAYHDGCRHRDHERSSPRQRRPGGGRKGALPTSAENLVFLLFSFRH